MVGRNSGHIVFTGLDRGIRPTANSAVYSATKAALQAFADGLRMDCTVPASASRCWPRAGWRPTSTTRLWAVMTWRSARLYSGARAVQPADIAALVGMVLTMPAHVDVTRVEVVPTMQVFGGSAVAESS